MCGLIFILFFYAQTIYYKIFISFLFGISEYIHLPFLIRIESNKRVILDRKVR
jgi:hypothetical protein